ncbi:erythromycin esterase family protein [Actinomadura luteofluorescens]|uniref:erythromycin esterase family protein n=1 Tax=Actinomadura luteofluorescens TaxID=46163 RepID=UPI00362C01BF
MAARPWCGRTTPTWATRGRPTWRAPGWSTSASSPGSGTAPRRRAGRVRGRTRRGRRGAGLGRPDGDHARPPPARGSLEHVLAESELHRAMFVVPPEREKPAFFTDALGHRAIGVVYDPDRDPRQYVPTRLADRYDALCWFRATSALQPLHLEAARRGELETMPTGV